MECKVITKISYKGYLVGTQLFLFLDQPLGSMPKIDEKKFRRFNEKNFSKIMAAIVKSTGSFSALI